MRSVERVLLPGVGTDADLPLLPVHAMAIALELSPAILAQAQRRLGDLAEMVLLFQDDAKRLPVDDGRACAADTAYCLREGGRAVVFDKFVADDAALRHPCAGCPTEGDAADLR